MVSRKAISTSSLFLMFCLMLGVWSNQGYGQGADKSVICHLPNSGSQITLELATSAVDTHLSHGDFLGICEAVPFTVVTPLDGAILSVIRVTVQIESPDTESITVTNLTSKIAVPAVRQGPSDTFLAHNVLLVPDSINTLTIEAVDTAGQIFTRSVTVQVNPISLIGEVLISASPNFSEVIPTTVHVDVIVDEQITATELLIDQDGDGVTDEAIPSADSLTLNYEEFDRFVPVITARLDDNVLTSSAPEVTTPVAVLDQSFAGPTLKIEGIGPGVRDMAYDAANEEIYVLIPSQSLVKRLDSFGSVLQTINLPGTSNPQGIDIDQDANLYVADTGNNRILVLLAASNYQPDPLISPTGTFGVLGSGPGQLDGPKDVAAGILTRGVEDIPKIFVADTGNGRIQRFNRAGVFEDEFDGAASKVGSLVEPSGLFAPRAGGLYVMDGSLNRVFAFSGRGSVARLFGQPDPGRAVFTSAETLVFGSTGQLIIPEPANNRIQFLDSLGNLFRAIDVSPLQPLAAVTVRDRFGDKLIFSSAGSSDLSVVSLAVDAKGQGPADVVGDYLAVFADQDLDAMRGFLSGRGQEIADELEADPVLFADAASIVAKTVGIELIQSDGQSSIVEATFDDGTELIQNRFYLVRFRDSSDWKIQSH